MPLGAALLAAAAHRIERLTLEGSRLPSGLYFVRIAGERFTAARRLATVQ